MLPIPPNDVWHAYDPLPFWEFLAGIRIASELTEGRRFLDLGCGIGTKLAIMHGLGWDVTGVEHHAPYVEAARELIPEASVHLGDICDLVPIEADLVYMYRPAVSDDLEAEVERVVLDWGKPGTVMFWPFRHTPEVWVI